MKKLQAVLLTACLMLTMIPMAAAAAPAKEIAVVIDGETKRFDVSPVKIDGRVFVPMRAIFESLGAEVEWNADKGEVTATKGAKVVVLTVGSATAVIDGTPHKLDAVPRQVGGRTMVPLRFAGEALGAGVEWVDAEQSVVIQSQPAGEGADGVADLAGDSPTAGSDDGDNDSREEGMPKITPEQIADDEAKIRAVIEANTQYFNEANPKFFDTYAEQDETAAEMEAYFKRQAYFTLENVSISAIRVTGNEATAQLVRNRILYEHRGTPEEYVSAILQYEFTVSLVRRAQDWKIAEFAQTNFKQLPLEG